jgi:hypothetical protein
MSRALGLCAAQDTYLTLIKYMGSDIVYIQHFE